MDSWVLSIKSMRMMLKLEPATAMILDRQYIGNRLDKADVMDDAR